MWWTSELSLAIRRPSARMHTKFWGFTKRFALMYIKTSALKVDEGVGLIGRYLAGTTGSEGFSVDSWPSVDEGALSAQGMGRVRQGKQAEAS